MKKGKVINSLLPQKKVSKMPTTVSNTQRIFDKTSEDIRKGLENPYASTGTPIEKLKGGAKFMAQLSNIGGGSVETGGGGVKQGFNTVANNVKAGTALKIEQSTKKAIGKKKK